MTPLPDRQDIVQALATITHLRTEQVQEITIKDSGVVGLTLSLPPIDASTRDTLIQACKSAVQALPGVKDVWVKIATVAPPPPPTTGIGQVKHIIAISSGKGGVGKTSVSVNVAVALAEMGWQVGILDADIYGPNVPLMLGMDAASLWVTRDEGGNEIVEPAFNYGVKMISMGFLIDPDQPVMWRGPMLDGMIKKFLHQANWGPLDYLIVDMPPGTGDAQLSLAQGVPLAGAIIVTTPQTVSLLDSRKGLRMFQNLHIHILGIVENMSYFIPPDRPDQQYDIFGSGGGTKTAQELGVPLLGCIPLEIPLREGGDRGVPIVLGSSEAAAAVALRSVAKNIVAALSTDPPEKF